MSRTSAKRWIMVLVVLLLCSGPGLAATRTAGSLMPTPLILKDGRIANVSVHVLPFQIEDAELGARASLLLTTLIRQNATDCFLTAQVIGHVGEHEVEEADTLRAHRLARSRADAVQASLIAGGLPAKSIASVWDWQFLVREPRATLWVFRLTEGEDCEGTPLEGAVATVADADPVMDPNAQVARPSSRGSTRASDTVARKAGADERANGATHADRVIPARSTEPSPEKPAAEGGSTGLSTASDAVVAAVQPRPAEAEAAARRSISITFATNSSYFPPDARERLEALVASMAAGTHHRIRLEAAVSGSTQVIGAKSPAEAQRYNRWLAERRLERIESWLARHASEQDFTVETSFKEDDGSRSVQIDLSTNS